MGFPAIAVKRDNFEAGKANRKAIQGRLSLTHDTVLLSQVRRKPADAQSAITLHEIAVCHSTIHVCGYYVYRLGCWSKGTGMRLTFRVTSASRPPLMKTNAVCRASGWARIQYLC